MVDSYRKLINKQIKMKKTYKDLYMVAAYCAANIYNKETKGQIKLNKIREKLQPYLDEYTELRDALRLEYAMVVSEGEKKGKVIIEEDGNYAYTQENLPKLNKAAKELADKEFDYTPILITNPEELEVYTFLKGWVTGVDFKEDLEEEIEL
jgi:hypothetical protein